ncbi:MAG: hypothetical protein ACFE96_09095 [Candidatus Hermodarchaeota archaeon]
MVQVKDIERLMDDFLIEPEDRFIDIKRYLLSEFDWKIDTQKKTQFVIRGLPIDDNIKLSDLLNSYLPDEVITLKEV